MADKRNNRYKILLQEIELKDGTQAAKSVEFEFENLDNIFGIIQKVQDKNMFGDGSADVEFALG